MHSPPQIMIIDDVPSDAFTLESLLFGEGYELCTIDNGPAALSQVAHSPPDLILLDVMMPGMDGFAVCRAIKGDRRWQQIPVIMVTALDNRQDMVRGFDVGADDFISKPVDGLELRARVRSMLRAKGLHDRLTHQLEVLEVLRSVGLHMMHDQDVESIVHLMLETTLQLVPEAAGCTMHFVANYEMRLLSFAIVHDGSTAAIHASVGIEEIVHRVLETEQPVHIPDATALPSVIDTELPICSLLAMPLADDRDLCGVLTVYSSQLDAFPQERCDTLSILASEAAVAMMRVRSLEELEKAKDREKRAIRELFERYVSPSVVDRLIERRENLALGGARQAISVLFADIRGFTRFSESSAPEQLIDVLNQYLSLCVDAVLAQEGTLDKFMGDAVMAIYNAPLAQPDHTLRAVRTALDMQRRLHAFNKHHPHYAQLGFGIGIHAGQAVVGNVGTMQQMNYTAIGDTVNVAKRLQERAEAGQIVLSQAAYEAVRDRVEVRDFGEWVVKGRVAPVHVYQLFSLARSHEPVALD